MEPRIAERTSTRGVVLGGAVAGIVAGLVMAMAAMIYAWSMGAGFWLPVRNIAAMWYGVDALVLGPEAPIVGVLTHMVNSAVFGIVFAFLIRSRPTTGIAFGGGLLFGVVIWALMTYFGLPAVNEVMYERTANMNPVWWFVLHLIFGGMLFVTPPFMQALSTSRTAERHPSAVPA